MSHRCGQTRQILGSGRRSWQRHPNRLCLSQCALHGCFNLLPFLLLIANIFGVQNFQFRPYRNTRNEPVDYPSGFTTKNRPQVSGSVPPISEKLAEIFYTKNPGTVSMG